MFATWASTCSTSRPIHPIGRTNRKGRNNSLKAQPGDPGSPYAIGAAEGGHDALHPELGSFEDFARLIAAADEHGLEIALDFAIQCSPDHPWIREHPEWFDWRADGTIRYAENPPKKYEDIVNVSFYREGPVPALWMALRDVVLFWVSKGVRTFRVDNPHTKPLPFWEWMIREVQDRCPDVIFLSEAFTRPKMMKRLAKLGFTQSYSYFTWRNTKAELTEYLTELTQEGPREHMRPNFFVNTPDINPKFLQTSGRAGFQIRAVLAATLSPLVGRLLGLRAGRGDADPRQGGVSRTREKYQLKAWDWDRPGNIRELVTRLNQIRRENPALWHFTNLEFLTALDPNVMVYCKMTRGEGQCAGRRGQSRPAPGPRLQLRAAALALRPRRPRDDRGGGPDPRGALFLGREDPARLARSGAQSICHLAAGSARPSGLIMAGGKQVRGDARGTRVDPRCSISPLHHRWKRSWVTRPAATRGVSDRWTGWIGSASPARTRTFDRVSRGTSSPST